MLSLRIYNCRDKQERDRTARALLNLGRSTGTVRPYILNTRNGTIDTILDTELLDRFVLFCATLEEYSLTDTEMFLFLIKSSTETNTRINEIDRALVFDKLADEILNIVEEKETEDKVITEEWRIDSEINIQRDNA